MDDKPLRMGRFFISRHKFDNDKELVALILKSCSIFSVVLDLGIGYWVYLALSDQFGESDCKNIPEYSYSVREGNLIFNKINDNKTGVF